MIEYWVVDPEHRTVLVHVLENGKYKSILPYLTDEDVLTSTIFPELAIPLDEVFPKEELES